MSGSGFAGWRRLRSRTSLIRLGSLVYVGEEEPDFTEHLLLIGEEDVVIRPNQLDDPSLRDAGANPANSRLSPVHIRPVYLLHRAAFFGVLRLIEFDLLFQRFRYCEEREHGNPDLRVIRLPHSREDRFSHAGCGLILAHTTVGIHRKNVAQFGLGKRDTHSASLPTSV